MSKYDLGNINSASLQSTINCFIAYCFLRKNNLRVFLL